MFLVLKNFLVVFRLPEVEVIKLICLGAAAVNAALRGGDIKLPSAKNAPITAKVTALTSTDVAEYDNDDPSTSSATGKPGKK